MQWVRFDLNSLETRVVDAPPGYVEYEIRPKFVPAALAITGGAYLYYHGRYHHELEPHLIGVESLSDLSRRH